MKILSRSKIYDILFLCIGIVFVVVAFLIKQEKISFTIKLIEIGYSTSINLFTHKHGSTFGLMVSIMYLMSHVYVIGYNKDYDHRRKLYFNTIYFFSALLAFLMSLAENMFTMFLFYETLTLMTYPLICFSKTEKSIKVSNYYLLSLIVPSILLLMPAIMLIYYEVGNTSFTEGGILSSSGITKYEIELLYMAVVFGIAKTAIIPMHKWLPRAMVASAPVSGMLHAVAVVKSGIFMLLMITYFIFGDQLLSSSLEVFFGINWLTLIAILGMVFASLKAFSQVEIKARLAYSTIAHLSIMISMISLLNVNIFELVIYYMFAHGVGKIILFYSTGLLQKEHGVVNIAEISGIGKISSFPILAFLIGTLSLFGFHGGMMYHAKHSFADILLSNNIYILLMSFSFTSICGLIYLGKIPYYAFFKNSHNLKDIKKSKFNFMKLSLILLILINCISYFNIF
jgi:multicomponent Na+:H+ antiporter subunit D